MTEDEINSMALAPPSVGDYRRMKKALTEAIARAERADAALAELQAPRRIEGTLPADDLRRAFVDGAAWWEFRKTEFTMWNTDRREAEAEAEARFPGGKPRPSEVQP